MTSPLARYYQNLFDKTMEALEIKVEHMIAGPPPSDARADFESASRQTYESEREGKWHAPIS